MPNIEEKPRVPKRYFVTAIGTDSGKTLVSAILAEKLGADYWKPVQCGFPRDTETVQRLVSNERTAFHPEAYLLDKPASPHDAAAEQGVEIDLNAFSLPDTENDLIVEGAGGLLVPLNGTDFVIDVAHELKLEVILVANLYLGSINHTLLSVMELKRRDLLVKGIVFNGPPNPASESIILRHARREALGRVPQLEEVSPQAVREAASLIDLA